MFVIDWLILTAVKHVYKGNPHENSCLNFVSMSIYIECFYISEWILSQCLYTLNVFRQPQNTDISVQKNLVTNFYSSKSE